MQQSLSKHFLHLIWSVDQRLPLLVGGVERVAWRAIQQESARMNARVVAIGGVADHVHLLVAMPTTISVAKLLNQIKGVSSRCLNASRDLGLLGSFQWQEGYADISFSPGDVGRVVAYIRNQKQHHSEGILYPLLETVSAIPPVGRKAEGRSAGAFTPR